MFYVRRRSDNCILTDFQGESYTGFGKLKDGIPLETLEQAKVCKQMCESRCKNQTYEIISVVTTISIEVE